jgi:hypothetical protein
MSVIHKTFWNVEGNRKVEVFQRDDKTFGFEEWRFSVDENAWIPFGKYSVAIIDTLESAMREAEQRVQWLSAEQSKS